MATPFKLGSAGELKAQGNRLVGRGKYEAAAAVYARALAAVSAGDPEKLATPLLLNLALCHTKTGAFGAALQAATRAVDDCGQADVLLPKALYRRAAALVGLAEAAQPGSGRASAVARATADIAAAREIAPAKDVKALAALAARAAALEPAFADGAAADAAASDDGPPPLEVAATGTAADSDAAAAGAATASDDGPPPLEESIVARHAVARRRAAGGSAAAKPSPAAAKPAVAASADDLDSDDDSDSGEFESYMAATRNQPGAGLKRGFLEESKSEADRDKDSQLKSGQPADMLRMSDDGASARLVMPEVQAAMQDKSGMASVLGSDAWVTPQLMERVASDPILAKGLTNPAFMEALSEFQTSPQAAMAKYAHDPAVQTFLRKFAGLLGEHFEALGKAEADAAAAAAASGSGQEPLIQTVEEREADEAARAAVQDPAVREAMMDPKVQVVIAALQRGDQAAVQAALRDRDVTDRIQVLVRAGVLGVAG
ncbi:uncharacterized protein AMSG_00718 [Thecamonas trahens ATCC 50062]|uniref:STI1/HOP DP domain-containing protein n=1 Tax=Thecamonas trahens ATCC 50062 TaxID=461836 RepID=A0A0L0DDZ5_THETB|nr:hypothetical protein AMSG_00718 [Thecamonas trahens ATCC 50062]KNC50557.1 hypothetical protein AMSG_00718 [Thecamonas trahens ATCC 50062]|eukprot:XP_013762447.1 hypothetical protein AMSG_00718 [Thecamonas trahens ATCC 50062]